MLYVGKECGVGKNATAQQELIHQLLLRFALSGKTVVRLKGGDPTVFGRGGEEMEYLERHGVRVQVVPGITAASGIAANLGVPLTHRDHANSVRFVTGHARAECKISSKERYPWKQLVDPKTTLVIYMGLGTLPELAAGLVEAGLSPDTPAVAVQDGTTPTQRVVTAQIDKLSEAVLEAKLRSPTLVLIGSVVSLMDKDAIQGKAAIARITASTSEGFAVPAQKTASGLKFQVSTCTDVPSR
jgi:uroporphyrin-III C-methyltransferase